MPFLLLLILSLACMPIKWPQPPFGANEWQCALLSWSAVGGVVGAAARLSRWTRWRLARDPGSLEQVLQRYSSLRIYHLFALFAVFGTALTALGWGWAVRSWCTP